MDTVNLTTKRVIAYVDGFNLFFGMKESGWQQFYWLNVCQLAENILPPNSVLTAVKYFTARVVSPDDKRKRQGSYLEALQAQTQCVIIHGKYQLEENYCRSCFSHYSVPKEKMTDVNIAVTMMEDAFLSRFDIALLVSGDSDLTPPVSSVLRIFPEKSVIVAFPPRRFSADLKTAASGSFNITRVNLRDSQLPDEITKSDGYVLRRPSKWR